MGGDPDIGSLALTPNKRLERTRHERASLLSCVGEPLKRMRYLFSGDAGVWVASSTERER